MVDDKNKDKGASESAGEGVRPTITPIGRRIKQLRDRKGWTRYDLAVNSGVSPTALHKIETGKTEGPRLGILRKIAHALGVHISDLGIEEAPDDESGEGSTGSTPLITEDKLWDAAYRWDSQHPEQVLLALKMALLMSPRRRRAFIEDARADFEEKHGRSVDEIKLGVEGQLLFEAYDDDTDDHQQTSGNNGEDGGAKAHA